MVIITTFITTIENGFPLLLEKLNDIYILLFVEKHIISSTHLRNEALLQEIAFYQLHFRQCILVDLPQVWINISSYTAHNGLIRSM